MRMRNDGNQSRGTSSAAMLVQRVRQVGLAWAEHDEEATRMELTALAAEAGILASMDPLFPPTNLDRRQQVMLAQKAPTYLS